MNPGRVEAVFLAAMLRRIAQRKDRKRGDVIGQIQDFRHLVHALLHGSDAQPYAAQAKGNDSDGAVLYAGDVI